MYCYAKDKSCKQNIFPWKAHKTNYLIMENKPCNTAQHPHYIIFTDLPIQPQDLGEIQQNLIFPPILGYQGADTLYPAAAFPYI